MTDGESAAGAVETKRRGRPPKAETQSDAVQVRVMRDYWNDEGRVRAGSIVSVSVADALKGVKSGAFEPVED